MRFQHLNVPSHWETYWTKYPEGYTILEALINWVGQVDAMVDNQNTWNEYLDNFVKNFDFELQKEVADTLTQWKDSGLLADIINNEVFDMKANALYVTKTFTIPTDFPNLQEAVNHASRYKTSQGVRINIQIESGHRLTSGLLIQDSDCRNIWITSVDQVVYTDVSFTGHMIRGINSLLPRLATVIDMEGRGEYGYSVESGSEGWIEQYCGIKNAGQRCGYVNMSSKLHAYRGIFTGAAETGLWVSRSSTADCEEADFSGAGNEGCMSRRASTLHVQSSTFNDCGQAMIASRAFINAEGITVNRTKQTGKYAIVAEQGGTCVISSHVIPTVIKDLAGGAIRAHTGGTIPASSITVDGVGESAVLASGAGRITLTGSTIRNVTGVGIDALNAANVDLEGATIENCTGNAVQQRYGATVNAQGSKISGNGGHGLYCVGGNTAAGNATIENNTLSGIFASQLAHVDARDSIVRFNQAGLDYRVSSGSQILALGIISTSGTGAASLADTNVNDYNTLIPQGIVWA